MSRKDNFCARAVRSESLNDAILPDAATALIAVIVGDNTHKLGCMYFLVPVSVGAAIMLVIALLINNIPASCNYPEF